MNRIILVALCLILSHNVTFGEPFIDEASPRDLGVFLSEITAYAPHDNKSGMCGGGLTSRGFNPGRHYAAVDPTVIPYGTVIFVPGYGEVIAADCGSAIKGYDIDIYFETYEEAINWGRRNVQVRILSGSSMYMRR